MADPFVAEIRIFGFNFAPKGWALCDGQILPISQNTALFSLVGTFYGGNGQSTFALPDLQGRVPVHAGNSTGPGLSTRSLGEESGVEAVTLLISEMPIHSHALNAQVQPAGSNTPDSASSLARSVGGSAYKATPFGTTTPLAVEAMPPGGGNLPHNNLMPYLTLNYCIALQGVYPSRS